MSSKSWHASTLGTRPLAPETLMMGYGYDPHLSERSLKPPLFLTSTFVFRSAEDGKAFFELAYGLRQKCPNEEPGLIYSRINNPDLEMLEDRLAIWDETEGSLVFASGRHTSVPIPKFASLCRSLVCELRNRRTLATY